LGLGRLEATGGETRRGSAIRPRIVMGQGIYAVPWNRNSMGG
jgi:hypothetical protein